MPHIYSSVIQMTGNVPILAVVPHRNKSDFAERVTNWGIHPEFVKGMYLAQKTYQLFVKTTKNFWITKRAIKLAWLSYSQFLKNIHVVISYFLNYFTKQSCSCKADSLSGTHEFIRLSCNPDFHVLNFKSLPNYRMWSTWIQSTDKL
jgi:hypothetical protein